MNAIRYGSQSAILLTISVCVCVFAEFLVGFAAAVLLFFVVNVFVPKFE